MNEEKRLEALKKADKIKFILSCGTCALYSVGCVIYGYRMYQKGKVALERADQMKIDYVDFGRNTIAQEIIDAKDEGVKKTLMMSDGSVTHYMFTAKPISGKYPMS